MHFYFSEANENLCTKLPHRWICFQLKEGKKGRKKEKEIALMGKMMTLSPNTAVDLMLPGKTPCLGKKGIKSMPQRVRGVLRGSQLPITSQQLL